MAHGQISFEKIADLPGTINETSGLIYFDGKLISHNDSGNDAALYELDPSDGSIIRTVALTNTTNIDWEDLAQDSNYIYIGDFGNSKGDRTDLKIYRIAKSAYLTANTVFAEEIHFSYADQTNFTSDSFSNWDAEAMVNYDSNLIVFTKQWKDLGTVAYRIPTTPGTHNAIRLDSYQVDGLITGATYDADTERLVLVGYSQLLIPFLVQVEQPQETAIFSGAVTKRPLDLGFNQIEGVTQFNDTYYLSSEEFKRRIPSISVPSSLFSLTFSEALIPDPKPEPEPESPTGGEGEQDLVLYQPMGTLTLDYNLNKGTDLFGMPYLMLVERGFWLMISIPNLRAPLTPLFCNPQFTSYPSTSGAGELRNPLS